MIPFYRVVQLRSHVHYIAFSFLRLQLLSTQIMWKKIPNYFIDSLSSVVQSSFPAFNLACNSVMDFAWAVNILPYLLLYSSSLKDVKNTHFAESLSIDLINSLSIDYHKHIYSCWVSSMVEEWMHLYIYLLQLSSMKNYYYISVSQECNFAFEFKKNLQAITPIWLEVWEKKNQ